MVKMKWPEGVRIFVGLNCFKVNLDLFLTSKDQGAANTLVSSTSYRFTRYELRLTNRIVVDSK